MNALDRYLDRESDAARAAMLARVEHLADAASEECGRAIGAHPWLTLGSAAAAGAILAASLGSAGTRVAARSVGGIGRLMSLL